MNQHPTPRMDEKLWGLWLLRGQLQSKAADRKMRMLFCLALAMAAGWAYFTSASK